MGYRHSGASPVLQFFPSVSPLLRLLQTQLEELSFAEYTELPAFVPQIAIST